MKIGISVITKNRERVVNFAYNKHCQFSGATNFIIIDDNSEVPTVLKDSEYQPYYSNEWLGVAGARNMGLAILQDCDFIFIMDDDVFPKVNGWQNSFIRAHYYNPEQHIFIASPNAWGEVIQDYSVLLCGEGGISQPMGAVSVKNPTGVLFFLTQHALKTLGGFEVFGKYGFEDVDYLIRAQKAGLSPLGQYVTVKNCEDLLHICDVSGSCEGFEWEGKSVLHDTKNQLIEEARIKLTERLKDNKIFKPYK
jgi:glycosyltransferase involved in cell wall biosynthesis